MARVEHTEKFLTRSGAKGCTDTARKELVRLGGTLERGGASEVLAKLGSNARRRLLGGMFVAESTLPVRARVSAR